MNSGSEQNQPMVTFTVDGDEYTTNDRRQTAAEWLALAGVSSDEHDLARILGHGEVERRFSDGDDIQLTPGAAFVSIFSGSTPVV